TRARSDRVTLVYRTSPEIPKQFGSVVQEAAVVGEVRTSPRRSGADINGTDVEATVNARTDQGQARVEFEVFVAGAESATPEQAQQSIERSVNAAQSDRKTLGEIAPEVYKGLIEDLKGSRRGSMGQASYADIGDIFILEFKNRRGDRELAMMRRR